MKKLKLLILLSFCSIAVCNGQEKEDAQKKVLPKFYIEEESDNSYKELERIRDSKKIIIQRDGQCTFYFDEELNENIYRGTSTMAEFEPNDTEFVTIIQQNVSLSEEQFRETFKICGHSFRFSIVIDEQGDIVKYTPKSFDASIRKGIDITTVDKQIEAVIKDIKGWKPATCKGKNVTAIRNFRIPTRWFQPRKIENNSKNME